jgi:hypothetical protein
MFTPSEFQHFATPAELAAYLATLPPPVWPDGHPIGTTLHNTYRPTEAQWAGLASMLSMYRDYRAKGWTEGPHFYLACHAPDPSHGGIWMMTPPSREGVHAGPCNGKRFGVEVVGDFQSRHWSSVQRLLILDTLAVVHHWAGIAADVVGHRDCMPGRTCPGDAMYSDLPALRADLTFRLQPPPLPVLWGTATPYHADWAIPHAWAPRAAELGPALTDEEYVGDYALQRFAHGIAIYSKTKNRAIVKSYAELGI